MFLVIGNLIIDDVFEIDAYPAEGAKIDASARRRYFGGQAANVAFTASALGAEVCFAGRLARDSEGEAAERALRSAGVDTSFCRSGEGASDRAVILVDRFSGERTIVMSRCPDESDALAAVEAAFARPISLVYSDGYLGEATRRAFALARQRGIPTAMDAEQDSAIALARETQVSHLIASSAVLDARTEGELRQRLERLQRELASLVVAVTAGPCPVLVFDGAAHHSICPRQVENPVDTTGAGDTFRGAYLAALAHGLSIVSAFAFAAQVAAEKCSVAGPRLTLDQLSRYRLLLASEDSCSRER